MANIQELTNALIKADQAGDVNAAKVLTREIDRMRAGATGPASIDSNVVGQAGDIAPLTDVAQEEEKPGLFTRIKRAFTGEERQTPEIQGLPSIGELPELNQMNLEGLKSALVTMTGSDEEAAQALKANFPNIGVKVDNKGNIIVRSAIDNKDYVVNKPGLDARDLMKAGLVAAMFSPTGRVAGLLGKVGSAAATQTGIEAAQQAAGGEFDVEQIPLAGAVETVAPGISKVARSARGVAGKTPKAIQESIDVAESLGVQPLTSDIVPPQTFAGRLGQAIGERVPITGTGRVRATQQEQRIDALKNVFSEFGAVDAADLSGDITSDLLKKRGKDLSKYTKLKGDVVSKLSTLGDVSVENTTKTIDDEVLKLKDKKLSNLKPVISVLEDYKQAIQGQSIDNLEAIRSQLIKSLDDPSLASVKGLGQKSLSKIYKVLRSDIGDFIQKSGDRRDFTKWKVANTQLAKMVGELESSGLKAALKKGDVEPEAVKRMLFSKKPSELKLLYKNLTPEGRNSSKVAILQQVFEKSGGIDNISPQKFITNLKRESKGLDVFLTKEDKKVMEGLVKTLNLTKRAAEAGQKPTTGAELTPFVTYGALSSLFGGPVIGGVSFGGIGSLSRIYESKPVRNIMVKMVDVKPGKEEILLNKLAPILQSIRQSSNDEK